MATLPTAIDFGAFDPGAGNSWDTPATKAAKKGSALAKALGTARPVVKTVLPTGPKPSQYATGFQPGQSGAFVPAPVEAPIAAPVPAPAPEAIAQAPAPAPAPAPDPTQFATGFQPGQSASVEEAPAEPAAAAPAPAPAFVAPKNQEELDALIAGGISSSDEEKNQRAMEETIKAKFQADRDLNVEEQKIKVANAEKEAKAAENYASEFRATNQKQKEILDSSYGYFAPTQENAKDIAGIFSILMLATMGSGTQNKYSGMNALASLTGAMKGYKEGREDVYRKEMASYDKNVAEFTRRTENSLKELKIAQEELAVDKDAAMARMRAVAAADSGSMASLKLRSGRLEEAIQLLKHQADSIRTHNEKVAALEDKKRRTEETISHNIETEELKARSLTEKERADKANEQIKKILAEEKVRTDQANESIRSILANEKIRADQKNETIKELLANERIRADKSNEVIKGLLVEVASKRATTYEKSVVEKTRHDKVAETIADRRAKMTSSKAAGVTGGQDVALIQNYGFPENEVARLNPKNTLPASVALVYSAEQTKILANDIRNNPEAAGLALSFLSKIDKFLPSRYDTASSDSGISLLSSSIDTEITGKNPDTVSKARQIAKDAVDVINARALAASGGARVLVAELRMQKDVIGLEGMSPKSAVAVFDKLAEKDMQSLKKVGFSQKTLDDASKRILVTTAPSGKPVPTISSKEQYDALPPDALYMEDGKQYRKPK